TVTTGQPTPTQPLSDGERKQILSHAIQEYAGIFKANNVMALAFPAIPCPAPLINSNGDTPGQKIRVNGQWVDEASFIWSMCFWSARIAAPSLSVPSGMTSGLPVGLMLQGESGSDSRMLGLGIA